MVSFGKPIPILRMFDETKAREFYIEFLGFKVDWEHRFEPGLPLYMQISKDGCVLHLSEHHGDCSPGAAMRIETTELETFHAELSAKSYKYARPGIEKTPWGTRDMSVKDPFGNRLTFTDPISVTGVRQYVEEYVSDLSGPRAEDAWHSLVEAGPSALPYVIQAFEKAANADLRLALVTVICEYRAANAVPFLAALLRERDARLWKAGLDGLVMLGGTAALDALASLRAAAVPEQREWIDEAIAQITKP